MIKTRLTDLLGIRHPIVLGGMSRATAAEVVAAVSQAGGFGTLGISSMTPDEIRASGERIRSLTTAPFGLNALLFLVSSEQIDAVFACRPRVIATAWRRPEYDLRALADRIHASGALHMHQADTRDGPPLPAATATSADTIARVKRRAISLRMLSPFDDRGTICRFGERR